MFKRLDKWLHDNIDDVMKWTDWFALAAFCFAAVVGCLIGNWLYVSANVCAVIWVMIARNSASYCEFCSKMLEDVIKKYEDLLNEHIALKKSISKKDNANDCK